jgi:hypothetical protein
MAINTEWHKKNKMPKNATDEEKIEWHLEYGKNCACRPMPMYLREKMKQLGMTKN